MKEYIVVIIFLTSMILFYVGSKVAAQVGQIYRERFTDTANRNLTELFLFVDAALLFRLNILLIVLGFVFTWIFTTGLIPAIVVAILLVFLPKKVYELLKRRRINQFVQQLPDTLLMLSSSMKAGSSLLGALETLVANSSAPTNQEFDMFLQELRIGGEFSTSLDKLAERMPEQEVKLVVSGMKISKEVGGNLADMLVRLADTLRKKLEMEGKIKALTSQGKAQGIVMSLLPSLIVLTLSHMEPEAMDHLFHDPIGWGVIGIALMLQYVGYRFIKKIVTIDV